MQDGRSDINNGMGYDRVRVSQPLVPEFEGTMVPLLHVVIAAYRLMSTLLSRLEKLQGKVDVFSLRIRVPATAEK